MNIKDKEVKCATNPFASGVSESPHFLYTSSTKEIDATAEVPLGFAPVEPSETLMEFGLPTLRALSYMGISRLKTIRGKAEEDSERNSGSSLEW